MFIFFSLLPLRNNHGHGGENDATERLLLCFRFVDLFIESAHLQREGSNSLLVLESSKQQRHPASFAY